MMELPEDTISTLNNIQDTNAISDDAFLLILERVVSHLNKTTAEMKMTALDMKPSTRKSTLADVMCLFTEAARCNLEEESLESFLRTVRINGERSKSLCAVYSKNKRAIQTQLELIGYNPLHVIDVDWRLDYCVKFDTCNSVGVPIYHIRLKTKEHEGTKYVVFTCTIQRLQELVSKLKDAVRHMEKLSNV